MLEARLTNTSAMISDLVAIASVDTEETEVEGVTLTSGSLDEKNEERRRCGPLACLDGNCPSPPSPRLRSQV